MAGFCPTWTWTQRGTLQWSMNCSPKSTSPAKTSFRATTIKFNAFDQIPDAPRDTYFEIIGVVNDVKNMGVQESPEPESAFLPYTITGLGSRVILIKGTASDPPTAMLGNLTSQDF